MIDASTIDAALRVLRSSASSEMSAGQIASQIRISRGPSSFSCPENFAKEALKKLVYDGYAVVRRARTNLYRMNPEDTRSALPEGFRYERRRTGAGVEYTAIVTPEWGNGGPTSLILEGQYAEDRSALRSLTWTCQPFDVKPLPIERAVEWLRACAPRSALVDRDRVAVPLIEREDLQRLAKLVALVNREGAYAASPNHH
jgi:hypothetical protein